MDADLRIWLERTRDSLGSGFRLEVADGFAWVTDLPPGPFDSCRRLAAHGRRRVGEFLPELDLDPPGGCWPILLCAETDDLCRHLSALNAAAGKEPSAPETIPGGVWVYHPVGHFLMPYSQVDTLDGALAHELIHAALRELPTPLWVEEGLATGVETAMGHRQHPLASVEDIAEFRARWHGHDPAALALPQHFRDPASSRHAYALAQAMTTQLMHDRERFLAFLHCAHHRDNGDAALRLIYGGSLAELVASVLDPPPPRSWLGRLLHAVFGV